MPKVSAVVVLNSVLRCWMTTQSRAMEREKVPTVSRTRVPSARVAAKMTARATPRTRTTRMTAWTASPAGVAVAVAVGAADEVAVVAVVVVAVGSVAVAVAGVDVDGAAGVVAGAGAGALGRGSGAVRWLASHVSRRFDWH